MTVQPDERSNQNTRGNDSGMGWRGWKERGAQAYSRGEYAVALQAYSHALRQGDAVPIRDRQLLLSNMVACRLQLGGPAQAEAAVANAKQCIALNDLWAKGHLRLASAYIALGEQASNNDNTTNYSNDACNALQRALQLDPRNPTARDMLIRELRSRNYSSSSAPSRQNNASIANANANASRTQDRNNTPADMDIDDDGTTWQERVQFQVQRARLWYLGQSEDVQSLVKVGLGLMVLYVAFGGRFGLEYFSRRNHLHHYQRSIDRSSRDNVYDELYHRQGRRTYDDDGYDSGYYTGHHHHRSRRSFFSSDYLGIFSHGRRGMRSVGHTFFLTAVAYGARRFFGIGPDQILSFVNTLFGRIQGARRR